MRIDHLEILNFRKLLAVRVDLSARTTLLVGANNSGKTSAMIALRHFLVDSAKFCMNDGRFRLTSGFTEIGLRC